MALETGNSLYWHTKIDNTGLQTGAVQAKGILTGLGRSITGMDIFAGLAIGATLIFAKITKQAYNFSKEFETAMKEVQTISKAVQNNFKGISKEIIDMSKTVPDNAQKLTKALYQIVSAGYDGAEAMDILRISAELAVATVTDTFTAADALTYVMNAYGKAAGTASEISDKLFTIVRLGKVKMEELGPTISMVTGLAAQMGLSFNELAAIYAEAVKKLQPHIATTGIRGILTAMLQVSKGTGEAADAARELGIEFDINALKSKGFKQVLQDIIEATKGNEAALGRLFPNIRGLIGLLSIMTGEGEGWNKTLNEIENSLGATGEGFKIMMDTTENQMAIMKNNVMAKLKPLGDSILKQMNDIASGINQAMSGVNDEFSNLARAYSELTYTLRKKQSRIDDLIATIEGLRSKTELSREETTQLEAAERALATFYPTFEEAVEGATGKIDLLTLAKKDSYELSKRIIELELRQAEIEKRRADLALAIYKRGKDEANEEIKRMQDRLDRFRHVLSIQQIIELQTTGEIKEEIRLQNELSIATEKRLLEQEQLILNVEKTTSEIDALTEALEKLGKPIIIPPEPEKPPEKKPVTILALTDEQIKDIEDKLKYMANQYKRYLSDVAQFGEDYVKENNTQLAEEGKNYAKYLSDMAIEYKDNAELSRIISDDIYEYNKLIVAKRKEAEEKLFEFIATNREQDLAAEKDNFDKLDKASIEYLSAVEKHKENEKAINLKYDQEIAEAKLVLFKAGWEKQIGEEKEAYIRRLEGKLKELEAEKVIDIKRVEFIRNKLNIIRILEEESIKEKKEILESYFKSYQTAEEKIVAIHEETARLLKFTDDKYEQDRLRIIEEQLIAEIKFSEAKKEVDEKLAEYGEDLNNEELENKIKTLEEMKLKYAEYADIIILLNEKIAESQKQIWENTRDEIDKTIDSLHALADVVGNFDTELEEMINDVADLISKIGDIKIDFSTWGGIAGTLTGILGIINTIINLFVKHKSDVPELREELQAITLELQKQQNILSQSIGTAKTEAIQDTIDLLNEQIDVYNEMIEAEKEAYGQFLWWTWSETDQEKIEEWLSSIENISAEIANLNQQYQQILTGTTAETIADAIAEGFSQGLDSAQVFADTFNDMMKKAIVDAFKRTIITQYLQRWYQQFAALSEGGLTPEEINMLAQQYLRLLQTAETQWETVQAILESVGIQLEDVVTDIAGGDITGLTGAIAGITEETAGLLAGQFQAIRINTIEILTNMESIIIINARIADNTEYNRYLESIDKKIGEGNTLESEYLRSIGGV